jgi:Arc/MetJ family transcription regulator
MVRSRERNIQRTDPIAEALGTAIKKETVNAALREVAALAARRRDLQRLTSGGLPDLEDQDVMQAAWQR